MLVLLESYGSISSQSSNPRLDFVKAMELVNHKRDSLIKVVFPYVSEDVNSKQVKKESIDDLFDQLDAIVAKEKAKKEQESSGLQNAPGNG